MKLIRLMLLLLVPLIVSMTQAQEQSTLACGDTHADQFTGAGLLHTYSVDVDSGTRLIIHTDPLPLSADMTLTVEVQNTNGGIIGANPFSPDNSSAVIETDTILSGGTYDVIVTGNTTGTYQMFVSCVSESGDVISNNNLVESLSCGEQVDNIMVRPDELHRYYLTLEDGMVMDLFLEALYGGFAEMNFEMGLYSPSNQELNRITADFRGIESQILEQNITASGVYRLYARGFDGTGEDYRIAVDCTLPDGNLAISGSDNRKVLEATILDAEMSSTPVESAPSDDDSDTEPDEQPSDNDDMPAVDVPLTALIEGIPNTGQVTGENDIVAYSFDGAEGETVTLNFARVRGDAGLELWVQSSDDEVYFGATLDITNELSAVLTLPASDDYQLYLALVGDEDVVFTVEVVREN